MLCMGPITAFDPQKEARAISAVRHALELLRQPSRDTQLAPVEDISCVERINNERRLTLEMFAGWRGDALPVRAAS